MYRRLFPPGKSGGLIEATTLDPPVPQFPPGKASARAAWCGTPRGFRRVNPAASLKRMTCKACSRLDQSVGSWFPPGKSGGLIEAWRFAAYRS